MRIARLLAIGGLLLASLVVAACTPKAPNIASAEASRGGVPVTDEHTLAPGDEFEIRFPFYLDLNDRVIVGPDGRLSLQLINSVMIGGLTISQATKLLNERYGAVIRNPQLSVTMRAYAPQAVFVDGWVANPGIVRSDVPLTVSRALAQAGGAKSGAQTDNILLLRRSADGKVFYYQVALGNYAGAGGDAQDPLLKSYDVVYVPQTAFATASDILANYIKNIPFYFNYTIQ